MRIWFGAALMATVVLVATNNAGGQESPGQPILAPPRMPSPAAAQFGPPVRDSAAAPPEFVRIQADEPKDDDVKKQVELLRKQVELQQKMIELLAEQLKKQPPSAPAIEKLQAQTATLEARSVQAAQRDQQLESAVDALNAHIDADERNGPRLPTQLKELFFPSQTNESPLSIYSTMAFGYAKLLGDPTTAANGAGRPDVPGGFYFGEFSPDFFLKLNEWILFEGEISVGAGGTVNPTFLQADFFVNDWLTIIAGRFVAPIGWYNERLNNPWINKLPGDAPGGVPILWMQVLPPTALLGVQAQGSFYLGCSPIKLEYNAYVSNAMNVTPGAPGAPTPDELANLEGMEGTFSLISNQKAFGGRIGLWWPEVGLAAGLSAMYNGPYMAGFNDSITLWAADFNYRKGNWDFRFEYGALYQQAGDIIGTDIVRQGFYGQLAYRPRDSANRFLQKLEFVYRYSYVNFQGIDPTTLTIGTYPTPVDVPVTRQQNAFGLNYYISPRMLLQAAYEINDEPGFHLHDNNLLFQLAWGW
ncbi:MAG TPA: hypothetical protein VKS79_10350 [Gemmataceae bacterium]|nr:hypothetical protein [Gemmataceae bacterium]